MDLATVKGRLPWYYAKLLDWQQDGDIIKAIPKNKLSYRAHETILKLFKRFGGAFVKGPSGQLYFELVLREPRSVAIATVGAVAPDSPDIHSKIGNTLRHLTETGRQLTASSGKRVLVGMSPPPKDDISKGANQR